MIREKPKDLFSLFCFFKLVLPIKIALLRFFKIIQLNFKHSFGLFRKLISQKISLSWKDRFSLILLTLTKYERKIKTKIKIIENKIKTKIRVIEELLNHQNKLNSTCLKQIKLFFHLPGQYMKHSILSKIVYCQMFAY